jgi:xanthine dehydrogenase accessory factor
MSEIYPLLRQAIEAKQPVATATLIVVPEGSPSLRAGAKLLVWPDGQTQGTLGDAQLDAQARADTLNLLEQGQTRTLEYDISSGAQVQVFIESFVPAPTLFIVGAVHIAIALVALAKVLGFRTVVIDAREAFATVERFPHADELVTAWPDDALEGRLTRSSYVAVLTHDPKLDDPALRVALNSAARYVGALGSPSTHARRLERLRADGLSEAQLARIHGPIGLAIGARTPDEIALSILAEIIQVKRKM